MNRQQPNTTNGRCLLPLLLPALLLAFALPAHAQKKTFELTPSIGYQWSADVAYNDLDFGFTKVEPDQSESYGLTFDIPITRNLQVELLVLRQDTELEITEGFGQFDPNDIELTYYHAGVLWQGTLGQVRPFVVGTAGITRFEPGLTRFRTQEEFSIGVGGGVKLLVNDHFGFRFEGRLFATDVGDEFDHYYDDCCCSRHCDEDDLLQGRLSAGLILAF